MKYSQLTGQKPFLYRTQGEGGRFMLANLNAFIVFQREDLTDEEVRERNRSWKLHFSLHPEDVERGWDEVIYPILQKHADFFKVIDAKSRDKTIACSEQMLQTQQKILQDLLAAQACLDDGETLSEEFLAILSQAVNTALYEGHSIQWSELVNLQRLLVQEEHSQSLKEKIALVIGFQKAYLKDIQAVAESAYRVRNGMQVTVYPKPGNEMHYQSIAELIELKLMEAGIRAGKAYYTDKRLGKYSSTRHVGTGGYQDAQSVKSYNPDSQPEVFDGLAYHQARLLVATIFRGVSSLLLQHHDDDTDMKMARLALLLRLRGLVNQFNALKAKLTRVDSSSTESHQIALRELKSQVMTFFQQSSCSDDKVASVSLLPAAKAV